MKSNSDEALKLKDALIDAVDAGDEQAIRRIVQQIRNSKFPTKNILGRIWGFGPKKQIPHEI